MKLNLPGAAKAFGTPNFERLISEIFAENVSRFIAEESGNPRPFRILSAKMWPARQDRETITTGVGFAVADDRQTYDGTCCIEIDPVTGSAEFIVDNLDVREVE